MAAPVVFAIKSLAPCVSCLFYGKRYSSNVPDPQNGPSELRSLARWISEDGFVNYDLLLKEPKVLFENMCLVEQWSPRGQTREAQLAFYINAYNITTMCMVLERMASNPTFEGNLSSWDKLWFFALSRRYIAGEWMTLDHLEHQIIRGQFNDPRIHCAINCGSYACPRLCRSFFTEAGLEQQLEERTRDFINQQGGVWSTNLRHCSNLTLSKIFMWYQCDFDDHGGGLVPFIQRYWEGEDPIPHSPTITFEPYDWRLNSSANHVCILEGKKMK